jgi:hypothetical protein
VRLIAPIVSQTKPQARLTEVAEAIRLLGRDHSTGVGLGIRILDDRAKREIAVATA